MALAWHAEPRLLTSQILLLIATGLTGGASMLMLVPVVNSVAGPNGAVPIDLPVLSSLDLSGIPLAALLGIVVALVALQAFLTYASSVSAVRLQQRVVDRMRSDALTAILAARWEFVLESRRSDITEIATVGASRCGAAMSALLRSAVSAVLATVTALVALVVAPILALLTIAAVVAFSVGLLRSLRPAHEMGRAFGRHNRVLQSVMLNSLDSLRLVRAHGSAGVWADHLSAAFADTRATQLANARRTSRVAATATVGLVASAALLVLVAVELDVPPATIVVILVLAARLSTSVRGTLSSLQVAANSLPAVADMRDLTRRASAAAEGNPVHPEEGWDPDLTRPAVSLREVTYHYPGSRHGVADLSFDIARGRITALVGPSGAGKSTTADLVLGLLLPRAGTVEVDGVPLTSDRLAAWRRRVAYVPQDTLLLPGSVRFNLTWSSGRADMTDSECWAALEAASAGFVRALPDGLDTDLGDRGVRLSGGQRQRLAIARALVRNPDVIVLDEATSALDDATESAVLSVLASLTPSLTVLVIAHRSSTIGAADTVVTLAEGRLQSVQSGRPAVRAPAPP